MGRFINADAFTSTGQGILGNNMFAYCSNNPVNYADENGQSAILALLIDAGIDGLVGGFVNAVCTFSTTGSLTETLEAFAVGFGEGFVVGIFDDAATIFKIWNAVSTVVECIKSGASWEMSLVAGLVALGAGFAFGSTNDRVVDIVKDLTFGLASSLVSAGITESVQRAGQNTQIQTPEAPQPQHSKISWHGYSCLDGSVVKVACKQ